MHERQTEVLVAGAGPVGLWSALLLADAGVDVAIVDREERTAARSYACALHPATLKALHRFGLAEEAIARGRRIEKVAFYEGAVKRAELNLSSAGGDFPFLVVLPQNAFESLLEQRLRRAGVKVFWNHRVADCADEEQSVAITIEEFAGTSTGYIVPHWETVVKERSIVRAQFLLGADGQNSTLRQRLGLEQENVGERQHFAAYEFETDAADAEEVRVVLDQTTTNVLWPLPKNRFRWTFQLVRSELPTEFPEKERRAARLAEPQIDERIREYVQRIARHRAPWFEAKIEKILWCTEVVFERRLVKDFGRNRCWLAGDAAHQTGPVGVQSMNAGFAEAGMLAAALQKTLRGQAQFDLLEGYNREWRNEWRRLLDLTGDLSARNGTEPWIRERSARLLPCLPGLGKELTVLSNQLGLDWVEAAVK
ncbi:MAG TPA: NAD(P)/FAD-dependent oxidoreductase [Candidatus Acidoferrum sp.]|jgi:2-polyprenyl-6-methoxyphenol hydroxylase-like FAD-dependent oxidoreductase|nr:NAD(P)/FAD-dependent oxidoreductase [Candidatus Acidoferrum sp.]